MWLLCQNKYSYIYIQKTYTDSISVSNWPPGASLHLSWCVIPLCLPQLFPSLSLSLKPSDKGKTRKRKSHPCYQWCSRTHLQKAADLINRDHICEQNVNSNMEAFAKGLIKQFLLVKGRPATQLQSGGKSACRNIKDICTSGDAYIWRNKHVQKQLGK